MTEKDIIAGLNSIAAKYGYGKNGNEAFSNDEWSTIEMAKEIIREYETQNKRFAEHCKTVSGIVEAFALSLVKHAIAEQATGHDGVSAEYIAQKAKEYILQNREVNND